MNFDIGNPFSSFEPGAKFNGVTGMMMQENEDFEKAELLLKEWIKAYGLFEDELELKTILKNFHLDYDSFTPWHKQHLITQYIC